MEQVLENRRPIDLSAQKVLYWTTLLYTVCIYGPMAMMSIGAAFLGVMLFVLFGSEYKKQLKKFSKNPFVIPTLWLSIACIASLFWAHFSNLEFYGKKPEVHWLKDSAKIWHILYLFLLAPIFSKLSDRQIRSILLLWLVLGFLSAVLGIVQHYVPIYQPLPLPDVGLIGYFHATGMTGFHLSYATIIGFPTAVWFASAAMLCRHEKLSKRTLTVFLVCSIFFIAHIFTYSKINWIAIPLTILLIAFLGFQSWIRWGIFIIVIAFGIIWGTSKEVQLRFRGTDSIKERVEVWSANIEMIKQHPILGVGWHKNSELSYGYYDHMKMHGFSSHAHNNILDQWATTGLFGLIPYLWWCFVCMWLGWQLYRSKAKGLVRAFGLGVVGGWFCLHLNGLTQTNFWDAKILHQVTWVAAFTMELYRRNVSAKQ
ncbi:MAG: O-antigen ligase family protein [Bacteriovoracia bacterium]